MSLEAIGLDFSYGSVPVLFGVDLDVVRGEVLALLGATGAGKSALLELLAGLHRPTAGMIRLDGEDITSLDAVGRVARGVVLVQGNRAVYPDLTVTENLEIGIYSSARRTSPAAARERRATVLDQFPALRQLTHRRAGSLSGGEQQQLAIAKGLLPEPRVLMIDELSLGLAPEVQRELVALVRGLSRAGISVVLVEPNPGVAWADRSCCLNRGRLFAGTMPAILERQ